MMGPCFNPRFEARVVTAMRVGVGFAAGTFKLWIRDGSVARYRLDLAGRLRVRPEAILMQQSSVTVLHHVGTTAFALTESLRRKLER